MHVSPRSHWNNLSDVEGMACDNVITLAHVFPGKIYEVKCPNVTYTVIVSSGMTITALEGDFEFGSVKSLLSAQYNES